MRQVDDTFWGLMCMQNNGLNKTYLEIKYAWTSLALFPPPEPYRSVSVCGAPCPQQLGSPGIHLCVPLPGSRQDAFLLRGIGYPSQPLCLCVCPPQPQNFHFHTGAYILLLNKISLRQCLYGFGHKLELSVMMVANSQRCILFAKHIFTDD